MVPTYYSSSVSATMGYYISVVVNGMYLGTLRYDVGKEKREKRKGRAAARSSRNQSDKQEPKGHNVPLGIILFSTMRHAPEPASINSILDLGTIPTYY